MTSYLDFPDLATELLSNIYLHANSLQDLIALSSTCRRLRKVFVTRKLTYMTEAISTQYGPLSDAVQLVTHNTSQPAHIRRKPPISDALLKQVVQVGRVAAAWEDIYPSKHWQDDYASRRLLDDDERYVLRRAIYRLWLYSLAFHTPATPRRQRMVPVLLQARTLLLHNFSTSELAEMADMQAVLREVLKTNVCPSNGTIERKFRKRFPDTNHQLLFNLHLNYPSPISDRTLYASHNSVADYKHYAKYRPTASHDPGSEGWGDEIAHYYVIEDMLKLDPGQVLWLRENCVSKWQVESFVSGLGEWFGENGQTWGQTVEVVLKDRGLEAEAFWSAVEEGVAGIAVEES